MSCVWKQLIAGWFSIMAITVFASANAATTVYGAAVIAQTGPVTNPNGAIGAADGSSAVLTRPGTLILALTGPASGAGLVINGQLLGNGAQMRISLGAFVNGVAVFTATQNFPRNATTGSFDFSADCAAISATGCTMIQFAMAGSPSGSFVLDGVSAVGASPEPGQWAMMIIGFVLVAWRLKANRRSRAQNLAIA